MSSTTLRRLAALAVALTAAAGAATAPVASADDPGFGPASLDVTSTTTVAGAHPDVTTTFSVNTKDFTSSTNGQVGEAPVEPLKDVRLSLPAGLVGDAAHVPQCSPASFGPGMLGGGTCPADTQVGVATLDADLGLGRGPMTLPVYNLAPGDDLPGVLAFSVLFPNVQIAFGVRTASDGGLDAVITGINEAARLYSETLTLWGVPADPSHDGDRGQPAITPRVPLLRNPTSCAPQTTSITMASWIHPGSFRGMSTTSPATTGCDAVPFQPSVKVTADGGSGDAPTGLDVTLSNAQNRDPDGVGASDVRKSVVTLPAGWSISPSAADGLAACDDAHVGIGADGPADCPDASKVGSATIDSPIIATPLTGPIYLGPSTAPGHYRVYVVVEGAGVRLKLPGDIVADPVTGRLTTTFDDTPQQPFNSFALHFDGGPRAVLASPVSCGTANTTTAVTGWSGASRTLTAPLTLGGGACDDASRFSPLMTAGLTNAKAGSTDSQFTFAIAREDRTQELKSIDDVTLPPGLTAKIGTVPACDAARAAAGTCGAESRVGRVDVTAGPGSDPLRLSGTAYLTGAYDGGQYGLSLVVPAIAGPYNLGTVVIRAAIDVAADARVSVRTDPLPRIVGGIPLRLRGVALTLDRPGFMVAPTSCADALVTATISGSGGAVDHPTSRFGLTGCRALPFAPKMSAKASVSTAKAGAGLHVSISQSAGQANLKSVAVSLPKQIAIKLKALGTTCTAAQSAAQACPKASQIGGASARTPLLADPLKGPVFLVQNGAGLPKLVALLQGDGLTIPLDGTTSVSKAGRLGTTFASIPDVPISAFDLDLPHNKRQILQTTKWPCGGAAARVSFTGQNGARVSRTVPVTSKCTTSKPKTAKTKH